MQVAELEEGELAESEAAERFRGHGVSGLGFRVKV